MPYVIIASEYPIEEISSTIVDNKNNLMVIINEYETERVDFLQAMSLNGKRLIHSRITRVEFETKMNTIRKAIKIPTALLL